MGTFQDVRKFIEGRLKDNWSTTDIAFDNIDYTPNAATAFVYLIIDEGVSRQITYGGSTANTACHRIEGSILVYVNVPLKTGTHIARGYADSIAAIFRNAQFSTMDILCKSTRIVRVGEVEGMFQYLVLTPFQVDVNLANAS